MHEDSSVKALVVQLSSLVTYLEKISTGKYTAKDLEMLDSVNGVLKDCIVLQKGAKLEKLKKDTLFAAEKYLSGVDYNKLEIFLNGIRPSFVVSQQRVSRAMGQMAKDGGIDPVSVKDNIFAIFETTQNKLSDDGSNEAQIQDLTLISAEAVCEVVRRVVAQEYAKLK
ncbi:MAG: hypothetical protein JW803_09425 [Endomicrobiales bacterium]|nr:hypothetical protein [Endomicrobiales bacterium]